MSMTTQADIHSRELPPQELDVNQVREDFPILRQLVHGKPLVYFDNAATTQKPRQVIEAIAKYYESQNANVHRAVHELSQRATGLYEGTREKVRKFINAAETCEIIYTRGTTDSINLVASSWGRANLKAGDEVVVSHLEHHSNIVPWQMVCGATGAVLRVIPINDAGEIVLEEYERLLKSGRVKLVAVNHVSNALGTINPIDQIIRKAHAVGALVLIDGAQWVAHGVTDVRAVGADFYAFSGHKMMAPTGIGILYGRKALLEAMPPYQGGGDMIATVRFEKTTYAELPNKFEAGTPNIEGVVGLGAAVDYLVALGLHKTAAYEHELLEYATGRLGEVPGLRIVGTARHKASVLSFVLENPAVATLDVGTKLDREGIAVRTGHHCCMPVMEHFRLGSTARASLAFYNTREEVDRLIEGLQRIVSEAKSRQQESGNAAPPPGDEAAIEYPKATAETVRAAAEKLASDFEFLGERDAKNEYVLDLAGKLPHLFALLQQVTTRVPGCMSQVYMVGRKVPGTADRLEFVADADAEIVRGLIAVLQRIYSGQRARDILTYDSEEFFRQIGLDQFITSQRRNGLQGMVARIRAMAKDIAND